MLTYTSLRRALSRLQPRITHDAMDQVDERAGRRPFTSLIRQRRRRGRGKSFDMAKEV